jgi:hypothetical protein
MNSTITGAAKVAELNQSNENCDTKQALNTQQQD